MSDTPITDAPRGPQAPPQKTGEWVIQPKTHEQEVFSLFFACAHIFPLLSWDWIGSINLQFADQLLLGATLFGATALLVYRSSTALVFATAALWVIAAFRQAPELPNHQLLLLLFDLCICFHFIKSYVGKGQSLSNLAGQIGSMIVAVYIFAAIAKVNTQFLSGENCGTIFYGHILAVYPFLPEISPHLLAYLTLSVELTLPLLLLIPATRLTAVYVGIIFHALLALDPVMRFYNFSAVMTFGLLACAGFSAAVTKTRVPLWPLRGIALLSVLLFLSASLGATVPTWSAMLIAVSQLWVLLAIMTVYILVRASSNHLMEKAVRQMRLWYPIPLLLIAVHGLGPYLGYKERASFSMYSNLVVRSDYSNHLFVPRSLIASTGVEREQGRHSLLSKFFVLHPEELHPNQCIW